MGKNEEYFQQQIENLGKRIKSIRKAKGHKNHEKFAYEKGINRSQYWRYEKGEDMKFSNLLRVLQGLDISLAEFFEEGFED